MIDKSRPQAAARQAAQFSPIGRHFLPQTSSRVPSVSSLVSSSPATSSPAASSDARLMNLKHQASGPLSSVGQPLHLKWAAFLLWAPAGRAPLSSGARITHSSQLCAPLEWGYFGPCCYGLSPVGGLRVSCEWAASGRPLGAHPEGRGGSKWRTNWRLWWAAGGRLAGHWHAQSWQLNTMEKWGPLCIRRIRRSPFWALLWAFSLRFVLPFVQCLFARKCC